MSYLSVDAEVPADVDAVFSILIHANFGINPVLYFVFKRDYRRLVRKWFGCTYVHSLATRVVPIVCNGSSCANGLMHVRSLTLLA